MRVLVTDRDGIVCRALARMLNGISDIEVVATTSDMADCFAVAGRLQPDIVLVDVQSFQSDGWDWLGVIHRMRVQAPAAQVIVLSIYATLRSEALAAGACRFLLKDCSRNDLAAAIRLADQGQCQQ